MKVKVPATTANIGPGFDTLGTALNIYNYYSLEDKRRDETLADEGFRKYFEHIGKEVPNYSVKIEQTEIPISRGLGSSASLIVGGVALANSLNDNLLEDRELLEIATEVEGHPDNVAPAIFGGLCVSAIRNEKAYFSKREISEELNFIAFIPSYKVSTEEARKVLPNTLDYKEAIENMGNTAMIISLIGDKRYEDLKFFLKDYFHEPYRKNLIRDYEKIKEISKENGAIGTYISGAGPTMMSLSLEENFSKKIMKSELKDIEILNLKCDNFGYKLLWLKIYKTKPE